MKLRKGEHEKYEKQFKFQDVRLRVAYDVLGEYQNDKAEKQNMLEKASTAHKALEEEVNELQTDGDKSKGDAKSCQGDLKTITDEVAAAKIQLKSLKAHQEKEKTSWTTEEDTLKQELAKYSSACQFIKTDIPEARTLCGIQEQPKRKPPNKKRQRPRPPNKKPKAEAPKQEEAEAEAPKQEEAKAEAPKQEQPKAEAPKQEEAKAEAPKQEQPKAEAPKQEEAKAEAPKQEQPKAEAPKQEEAKAEAPKA
ncbi:LOW QUALITY PROTEIN: pollen-specific leucine-rich repeat extensin-like protein 1 [Haplochromis burtoni]|uniref:LOW QUALITY PROTEIN: pollen-specific leucine-rich repeat extensin-like protein 1 n=1 Tax=Haplochromis burtoni TaxID=8153 RepID=UPI001C2DA1E3|nr:LOW QUALITY PROTEIN: pollen-specific leucine-rich repeat extensin-like protein 1 [Haplochromis burtoni]